MAFVLTVAGLLMVVTGARDTYAQFGAQVASDFTGPGNFTYWLASLGAVGSLGYIPAFKEFSRAFMVLIIVAMVLANKGLFANFTAFLKNGATAPDAPPSGPTSSEAYIKSTEGTPAAANSDTQAQKADNAKKGNQQTLGDFLQSLNPFASKPAY